MTRRPWTYGRQIDGSRSYLSRIEPFDVISDEIAHGVFGSIGTSIYQDPGDTGYSSGDVLLKRLGCVRVTWHIRLEAPLLDRFFNGVSGLRAQYYASPYEGRRCTLSLIRKIAPTLITSALRHGVDLDERFVRKSLEQPSAKIWIAERNLNGEKVIRASDLSLDEESIRNDWLEIARAVKEGNVPAGQYQTFAAALNGVRTPMADRLEVRSAWLTSEEKCEYVTPDKRDRDMQLFMFGFT